MHTHSLFTLLGERLMMHTNTVSITTYNTLYEVTSLQKPDFKDLTSRWLLTTCFNPRPSAQILTEQVCTQVVHKPHPEPDSTIKIQNPSE